MNLHTDIDNAQDARLGTFTLRLNVFGCGNHLRFMAVLSPMTGSALIETRTASRSTARSRAEFVIHMLPSELRAGLTSLEFVEKALHGWQICRDDG